MRRHRILNGLRDLAPIEGVRPVAGDELQASREVGIGRAIAFFHSGRRPVERTAVSQIDAAGLTGRRELLDLPRRRERLVPVRDESVTRKLDRRLDRVAKRQGPVSFESEREPGHRSGHGRRQPSALVRRALDVGPGKEATRDPRRRAKHRRVRAHRRTAVEVERDGLAPPGHVHEHRAGPGDRGHEGLDDRHGERGRHRGVDRVAATLENPRAHARSDRVLRGHHAVRGRRRLLRDDQAGLDHGILETGGRVRDGPRTA